MSFNPMSCARRNIIFFGETGVGKTSAINLILGIKKLTISNDTRPCTKARQDVMLDCTRYSLWDTRGLGEGKGIFGESSKRELEKFLKERHQGGEIDLLVYCVRGSRVAGASVKYYKNFCATTRQLAAPVVIMVTGLEEEVDSMDSWWTRNSSRLENHNMEFDGHVCVTTLTEHPRSAKSRESLIDLITKSYHWQLKEAGSYFGSRVPRPIPPMQVRKVYGWNMRRRALGGNDDQSFDRLLRITIGSSARASSYHAPTESPRVTIPPNPIAGLATPLGATTFEGSCIITSSSSLGVSHPPLVDGQTLVGSSRSSMLHWGSRSSRTSHTKVHRQPCMEEHEDRSNEPPFEFAVDSIRRRENYPIRRGTFGDIWLCDLIEGESSRMVAVKAVKTNGNSGDLVSQKKKLHREWKIWWKLQHENIVPLLGVVPGFGPLPSMVSPWFRNESLSRFLARPHTLHTPEKDHLLWDIAAGLDYLHDQNIVHGDLHSDNVLIDDHRTACLTDFGLSFISEFVGTAYLRSNLCGSVQFADPALVKRAHNSPDGVYPTKACDVYSFGGVMLHVISGRKPYDGTSQAGIFMKVLQGELPKIPTDNVVLPSRYRSQIEMCWDSQEGNRPSAEDLVNMFREPSMQARKGYRWNMRRGAYGSDNDERFDRFSSTTVESLASFHTAAESPVVTILPNPIAGSATPLGATTFEQPRIITSSGSLGVSGPSPVGDETPVSGSSSSSMLPWGGSKIHQQPCMEEHGDRSNKPPFEFAVDSIKRRENYPIRRGTFGDIWLCDLIEGESSRMVAVKAMKIGGNSGDLVSQKKKLHREWKIWWKLQHKNIVPLLGVVPGFGPLPSIVRPWFRNESLSHFLAHPHTLHTPEKDHLLWDVAAGLDYLHDQNIVHGNLHSDNVLIDDHGTACLTDFGLSFIYEFTGIAYLRANICGNIQFADPALVKRVHNSPDGVYPTKACDVYSFGGVALHVISGKKPYDGTSQAGIFVKILQGKLPKIPTDDAVLPSRYRSQIEMCWDSREGSRPSAEDLVKMFLAPAYQSTIMTIIRHIFT